VVEKTVTSYGKPSYTALSKIDKDLLINPLIDTINDYYKNPDNIKKFQEWLANKNPVIIKDNGAFSFGARQLRTLVIKCYYCKVTRSYGNRVRIHTC